MNDKYYNLPSLTDKRSAGIGYGIKLDFTKKYSEGPSPNKYHIKSEFDLKEKKGITMGTGRDKMKMNSILGNMNQNPGPGNYHFNHSTLSDIKYTIRSKGNDGLFSKENNVPGPDKYQQI